jgi:hypothetical protein
MLLLTMRLISILSTIAAVSAFPTVENLAQLAQREGSASVLTEKSSIEELSKELLRLKEKRLLFDPLTKPIDG